MTGSRPLWQFFTQYSAPIVIAFALFGAGAAVGAIYNSRNAPATGFPATDNKVEQAYRRSGFGDILTTKLKREAYSACYRNNVTPQSIAQGMPGEGRIVYVFHVGEDGRMRSYDLAIDEFQSADFTRCIEKNFGNLRFLPPPLGISRYLAHEFNFKTDETHQKEMEERKNKSPLELVIPTVQPSPTAPAK